ncbi:MAG: hypothetical protein ABIM89_00190 [Mycobacteriales bacterium]
MVSSPLAAQPGAAAAAGSVAAGSVVAGAVVACTLVAEEGAGALVTALVEATGPDVVGDAVLFGPSSPPHALMTTRATAAATATAGRRPVLRG